MKILCLLGVHKLEKMGGAHNIGNGKFEQRMICKSCGKIKFTEY